jgi:hypothetical protein
MFLAEGFVPGPSTASGAERRLPRILRCLHCLAPHHNAANYSGCPRPTSERARGKYTPHRLFEYLNQDIERTYLYGLIDHKSEPEDGN